MSTDLQQVPSDEILNPLSGELIRRDDLEAIASTATQLRELKRKIDGLLGELTEAAVEQARLRGMKTFQLEDGKLVVTTGDDLVWDFEKLDRALTDAGCPVDRIAALIKVEVSYKVDQSVRRQLEGASDDYKAAIASAIMERIPKRPSLKVET